MITVAPRSPFDFEQGQMILMNRISQSSLVQQSLELQSGDEYLPVGTYLGPDAASPWFQVVSLFRLPEQGSMGTAVLLEAMSAGSVKDSLRLEPWKSGHSLAWVTLSDKGALGEREDSSGPLIENLIRENLPLSCARGFLLPDSRSRLKALLTDLALMQRFDLILTTGGTGVGPRDITPEATGAVLEMGLPGFERVLTNTAVSKTPHGMISRARCGILGQSLIINLPGSPKAVRENLAAVLPAVKHTLEKAQGDPTDCG